MNWLSFKITVLNMLICGLLLLSAMPNTAEATPVEIEVQHNKVVAALTLPGGIETDFDISFDKALGLNAESIGITAELVNVLDPALLARLPDSLLTSVPLAFPMMITVEPSAAMGLSFENNAYVDIHTHNLEYTLNTPFRLFKAPLGGAFEDVTITTGAGSYRARGIMGGFSQFLVVADLRPVSQVINAKNTRLNLLFNQYQNAIDTTVAATLTVQLTAIDQDIAALRYGAALRGLRVLVRTLKDNAGAKVPNVWRSSRDIVNVAGELVAQAQTLSYSLRIAK